MSKRILIVDDEPDICEILRFNLEMEGYDVLTAEGADEAQQIVESSMSSVGSVSLSGSNGSIGSIDLILLDVMMTPKSGFEWAEELKADPRTQDIPIIFCTAKTLEEDLLHGFALGSDDYICKPFRVSEVKARVKAVMRRIPTPSHKGNGEYALVKGKMVDINESKASAETLRTIIYTPFGEGGGGVVLDLDRKECRVDGQEVAMTKLEFEVLALLLSKPGQVFSREKILQEVWPSDTIVLDRTVDVNITRIRKKIGRYGECLRTKFGYGYMFI